ncbi:MAG: hypothetical protein ACI97A_003665 [Planctomycetota bacterium]|jgi:hypothetical protein
MNTKTNKSKATGSALFLSACCLSALLVWSTGLIVANDDEQDLAPTVHQGIEAVKKTVGPEKCGECHEDELASWKKSAHQSSYTTMHKSSLGKSIAAKLGIRRIKKDDSCVRCHYSQTMVREKPKAKLGVSCESCHGPAKDWMPIHDDFGGKGLTRKDESEAHKSARHSRLVKAGMNHPDQLYYLASKCFSCHVMDEPKLMAPDVGHPTSDEFELLSWSQGEVRHNFVTGNGKSNTEADMNHRRVLFGLGQIIEVEYVLGALTKADAGPFFESSVKRLKTARRNVSELSKLLASDAGLASAVTALHALELTPKNPKFAALKEVFASHGKSFSRMDGTSLTALDSLLPKPSSYRGKSHQ